MPPIAVLRSLDLLHPKGAVEEREVRPMQPLRDIVQRTQPCREVLGPAPRREHVPVRETAATPAATENRFESLVVVIGGDVLEEVAEIEAIDRAGVGALEKLLQRQAVPFQAVEVCA